MKRAVTRLSAFLVVSLAATTAGADERTEQADRLFKEAKELIKVGKIADACPKFERSQQLDPGVGTQFNLADCYEKVGKVASAFHLFKELHGILVRVGDQARAATAEERARGLEGRLPKVTIDIPWARGAEGLLVKTDDTIIDAAQLGTPIPLDPGPHRITVRADRRKPFTKNIVAQLATPQTVSVPDQPEDKPLFVVVEKPSSSARRPLGLVIGGVGVAALGTGIVLGVVAKGNYDDAVKGCREPGGDTPLCPAGSGSVGSADSAKRLATIGTVVGAIGIGAVVTGAVLWLTAPKTTQTGAWKNMQITPIVGARDGAGFDVTGSF